jgi:Mg2+-importing ATPase
MVLRTNRPFYRSRPAAILLATSTCLAAVTVAITYTPIGRAIGLTGLPIPILIALLGLTALYVLAAEFTKRRFPPDQV